MSETIRFYAVVKAGTHSILASGLGHLYIFDNLQVAEMYQKDCAKVENFEVSIIAFDCNFFAQEIYRYVTAS